MFRLFTLVLFLNVLSRQFEAELIEDLIEEQALLDFYPDESMEVAVGDSDSSEDIEGLEARLREVEDRLREVDELDISSSEEEPLSEPYEDFLNQQQNLNRLQFNQRPNSGAVLSLSGEANVAADTAKKAAGTTAPAAGAPAPETTNPPVDSGAVPADAPPKPEGPPKCKCSSIVNHNNEGSSDCRSLFEEKAWCYVEPGVCPDAKKSTYMDHEWSFKACENPCECSGRRMKKTDGTFKGGADCESHWKNGDTWCYADYGTCADGKESKKMPGQAFSFDACPNPCTCSGVQNSNNEGGNDCLSIWEGKQWCYVEENACPDGVLSKSMGKFFSNQACDHNPPAVLSPGKLPEQCTVMACCGREGPIPVGGDVNSRRFLSSSLAEGSGFRRKLADVQVGDDFGHPGPKLKNRWQEKDTASMIQRRMPHIMHEIFTSKNKIPVIFIHNEHPLLQARLRQMAKLLADMRTELKAPPLWEKLQMQVGDVWVVAQGLGGFGLPCLSGAIWHENKAGFHSVEPFMIQNLVRKAVPKEGVTRVIFVGNNSNLMAKRYSKIAKTTAIGFPTQMSINRNGLLAWLDHSDHREELTEKNYFKHMRREISHTNGQEYTEIYINGKLAQGKSG